MTCGKLTTLKFVYVIEKYVWAELVISIPETVCVIFVTIVNKSALSGGDLSLDTQQVNTVKRKPLWCMKKIKFLNYNKWLFA